MHIRKKPYFLLSFSFSDDNLLFVSPIVYFSYLFLGVGSSEEGGRDCDHRRRQGHGGHQQNGSHPPYCH